MSIHRVDQLKFDLGTASVALARTTQDRISLYSALRLPDLLDMTLGKHDQVLDNIVIDLGDVPASKLEDTIDRAVRDALKQRLAPVQAEQEISAQKVQDTAPHDITDILDDTVAMRDPASLRAGFQKLLKTSKGRRELVRQLGQYRLQDVLLRAGLSPITAQEQSIYSALDNDAPHEQLSWMLAVLSVRLGKASGGFVAAMQVALAELSGRGASFVAADDKTVGPESDDHADKQVSPTGPVAPPLTWQQTLYNALLPRDPSDAISGFAQAIIIRALHQDPQQLIDSLQAWPDAPRMAQALSQTLNLTTQRAVLERLFSTEWATVDGMLDGADPTVMRAAFRIALGAGAIDMVERPKEEQIAHLVAIWRGSVGSTSDINPTDIRSSEGRARMVPIPKNSGASLQGDLGAAQDTRLSQGARVSDGLDSGDDAAFSSTAGENGELPTQRDRMTSMQIGADVNPKNGAQDTAHAVPVKDQALIDDTGEDENAGQLIVSDTTQSGNDGPDAAGAENLKPENSALHLMTPTGAAVVPGSLSTPKQSSVIPSGNKDTKSKPLNSDLAHQDGDPFGGTAAGATAVDKRATDDTAPYSGPSQRHQRPKTATASALGAVSQTATVGIATDALRSVRASNEGPFAPDSAINQLLKQMSQGPASHGTLRDLIVALLDLRQRSTSESAAILMKFFASPHVRYRSAAWMTPAIARRVLNAVGAPYDTQELVSQTDILGATVPDLGWLSEAVFRALVAGLAGGDITSFTPISVLRHAFLHRIKMGAGTVTADIIMRVAQQATQGSVLQKTALELDGLSSILPTTARTQDVAASSRVLAPNEPSTGGDVERTVWQSPVAGVVLLWPFLGRYFETLELCRDGLFVNERACMRAVMLIQYLASGHTPPIRGNLALPKHLCGLPADAPIVPMEDVTRAERELSAELLSAVCARLKPAVDLSMEALRGNYLVRDGHLDLSVAQKLTVAHQPFDLFLTHLPWPMGTVKLPAMETPLFIDWRRG